MIHLSICKIKLETCTEGLSYHDNSGTNAGGGGGNKGERREMYSYACKTVSRKTRISKFNVTQLKIELASTAWISAAIDYFQHHGKFYWTALPRSS